MTVVIPVRDEAERLADCIDALAAQDIEPTTVEVLVVDGGSADATVELARSLLAERGWARAEVLSCSAGDRSSNLNFGLAHATSPIVVRVDARSRVPANYLRRCAAVLEDRLDVAVVGGRQRAVPGGGRAVDAGVARALNNRWGMGFARYRGAASSGAADTVYLGAFRTSELRDVGGWSTDFSVNEDFDLNRRLARFGMVWFDAELVVDYVPRCSLRDLVRQYWAFGVGKARYWRLSEDRPRPRQVALLAAPLLGLGLLGSVTVALGPGAATAFMAIGVAGLAGIEIFGSDGPGGGVAAHLLGMASIACVAAAWLAGVVVATLHPGSRRPERERQLERAT